MLMHGLVLDSYGYAIIIPLLKILMVIEQPQVITGELQFGFEQHCSTRHALFTLKTVTEYYYMKRGSTVNFCALDIAKAFDRVSQFALL